MHGDARHVVTTQFDFSCVQANADINAQLTESISNSNPTLHGPCRTVEGGEHSIAHSLDQVPAESRQLSINRPIMLLEAGRPSPITDCSCLLGRAHDVGEEHRGQKSITEGYLPRPGQELLDLPGNVRSARPRDVVSRVEFYVAGTGNVLGEIASVVNPAEPVVASVEHQGRHTQAVEDGSQIGLRRSPHRPGRRRARSAMTCSSPPRRKARIGRHARSHEREVIPARQPWFDERFPESFHHGSGHTKGVVVPSREARIAVHQHERENPFRMGSGQPEGGQSSESNS